MLPSHARVTVINIRTLLLLVLWITYSQAQEVLERQVSKFATTHESLTGVAIKLASDSHVPFGVEVALNDENRTFDVTASYTTLRAELDRIIKLNPTYKWRMAEKVVNLLPKGEHDSLFDVRIAHFEKRNARSSEMVDDLLHDHAVLEYVAARKMIPQMWFTGSEPKTKGSILITNVTLREALDQVLIETHGIAWTAFYSSEEQLPNGRRIFMQLF